MRDDRFPQQLGVAVLDVAPVGSQMDGNAVGPGHGGHGRGRHRIGLVRLAGLPQGGDMVDVDAQANYVHDALYGTALT